ncbi:MAG: hypothetical protein OEM38_04120 [Gammaproteobacteria bacterium]|nr:hypothetical protein [Gammaproteobacteria bacterium]
MISDTCNNLIHRLKCKYPVGPIVNGDPEFGWREFGGPAPDGMVLPSPIMIEAAKRIEELEGALKEIGSIGWGRDGDCGAQYIVDGVIE